MYVVVVFIPILKMSNSLVFLFVGVYVKNASKAECRRQYVTFDVASENFISNFEFLDKYEGMKGFIMARN